MSFDHHGQLHAGGIGLFDDDYDYYQTEGRLARNEDLERARELHNAERERRKTEARQSGNVSWWRRAFKKKRAAHERSLAATASSATPKSGTTKTNRMNETHLVDTARNEVEDEDNWSMYDAEDVIDIDSEFYDCIGMCLVRGKSGRSEDNRVVSKSQIRPRKSRKGPPVDLLD
ncbi:hypothetical protein P280DRAFT_527280 [Massarina eburnea CBS 473.64]|uniref:Uncharacterized protein n=1 Tax=Massarina eburnea CBS 473.64 TaxID=1395130 RepID=A0A6A6RX76_9PLEO|nr:hypothetical protein P280DRAFT_527280 [Massarina eburnea CBS 473.64]